MKRAKSVTGLFWQAINIRWRGLSKGAKFAITAGLTLLAFAGTQAAVYALCPCSARSACSRSAHDSAQEPSAQGTIAPVAPADATHANANGDTACSRHESPAVSE